MVSGTSTYACIIQNHINSSQWDAFFGTHKLCVGTAFFS